MLAGWGYRVETASDGQEALDKLRDFDAGVVITDLMMPVLDGKELLRRIREEPHHPLAIVLTAFGNIETALEVVHDLGAYWFLEKPLEPRALRLLLERAAAQRRLESYSEELERQLAGQGVLGEMVGSSAAMQAAYSLIRQVAPTLATVLITGESGTGKELAARAVHNLSPRRDGPFVAINCASMPETLIESELFGHEKGSFTGAVERRRGCFELAHDGTLLLDEIGDMPPLTHAKLLRVLEEKRFRRIGGAKEIEVDVRVLASTNRDLDEMARDGKFREDLYFRLNVFRVNLPPLRQRKPDLPALCLALITALNKRHGCRVTGVEPATLEILARHDWPGNVRELRNILEHAVILTGEGTVPPAYLPRIGPPPPARPEQPAEDPDGILLSVGTTLERAERELVELTLRHTANNKTRAAAILGVSPKTLFNKLREYGAADAVE